MRNKNQSHPDFMLHQDSFPWLFSALLLTILPHFRQLPVWLGILVAIAMLWRLWAARRNGIHIPRWLLAGLTIATGIGVLLSYGTLLGRDAGIALLVAMSALKLVETRNLRDGMILVFLGYFLALSNLLYSQSIPMAAYLLFILVPLLASQITIQHKQGDAPIAATLRLSGRMLLQSVPVMLILFVLFPRVPGPLWGLPKDAYEGLTGLDDEMTPGTISNLIQSNEVAFRVRFDGRIPTGAQLYWRGPVLLRYDGRTWSGVDEVPQRNIPYQPLGSEVDYTITLEPHGQRWLYALDLPASFPADSGLTHSLVVTRRRQVNEVLRYPMRSYMHYKAIGRPGWHHFMSTRIPREINPRTRALGETLQQQYPEPRQRVEAVLHKFREESYFYTLQPPLYNGRDNIDDFLFDGKRGFCEHYAGSFVFLMRAAGVPARVVTGYLGGEQNEISDYFIVRQSDAHAWAEVWLEEQGWVRVDPTAYVAPQRIEQGLFAAVEDTAALPLMARRDSPWLRELGLRWDAVNAAWNEWILAYGPERQQEFLSGLGFGPVDWRQMTLAMVTALGLFVTVVVGLYLRKQQRYEDPIAGTYRQFCNKLARHKLGRHHNEAPLAYGERIARNCPAPQAAQVRLITRLYTNLRFGGSANASQQQQLHRLVARFKL